VVSANPSRLERVLSSPKSAGAAMFGAMLLAFVWVNSPYQSFYEVIHHAPMSIQVGTLVIAKPMISWINEGLMVFFFLIGLEIKREVYEGQLSTLRQVALPAIAAFGGMLVPAAIYLAFNANDPIAAKGWAIPAATDIVLALAFLALLGQRVPTSLKVFLTALAICDDFGTLVIIAVFYSGELSTFSIILALVGIVAALLLNRMRVTQIAAYVLVGVFATARAAVWMGHASLPPGVSWWQLYGVSLLADVGFTMSLFIAALAFNEPGAILTTKLSIVVGSLLSAAAGMLVLHFACRNVSPNTDDRTIAEGNRL